MNEWYRGLKKPFGTPPNWVFGPVWTILYAMIAASIYLYVKKRTPEAGYGPLAILALHIVTNLIWTSLFFGLRSMALALVDILVLDVTLVVLIVLFWRTSRAASILLWPYMLWVSFATYLNAAFLLLNRP
ncbi:MAG: TspO/MBR family protein [Planctomycetota bacterium]|jgi:tryptophan-rich sensory protein